MNQMYLFKKQTFYPLFWAQFLGAFNDNLFKNALLIFVLYRGDAVFSEQIISIAAGLFVLPFFVFSGLAGQISDTFQKARVVHFIKFSEIIIMILATISFFVESIPMLLGSLFLMGCQSAFFGPVKYSLLPEQLLDNELVGANALFSAGTFIAIILGSIFGGILILVPNGRLIISLFLIVVAVIGYLISLKIPSGSVVTSRIDRPKFSLLRSTQSILRHVFEKKILFYTIIGISWFWFIGATILSQLPIFIKDIVGANQYVVTLFLTIFSVGIVIGSLICNRVLKGQSSLKLIPFSAIGMTIFILDLCFTSTKIIVGPSLITIMGLFTSTVYIHIAIDLLAIAILGGLYYVPLYVILQQHSEGMACSKNIAANNIWNALFMVFSAVFCSFIFSFGYSVLTILMVVGILNIIICFFVFRGMKKLF